MVMEELLESMGCILRPSVTVENQTRFRFAQLTRHLIMCGVELRAIFSGNFICDGFSRKQIQNYAGVEILAVHFKAGNIADTNLVWTFCGKMLS